MGLVWTAQNLIDHNFHYIVTNSTILVMKSPGFLLVVFLLTAVTCNCRHSDLQTHEIYTKLKYFKHHTDNVSSQRGVMMCSADFMVPDLLKSIWQLRYLWRSSMGISVAHCNEISKENQDAIHLLDNTVTLIDVCSIPHLKEVAFRFKGFFCKVAALLVSPYPETMMVDLDVVFFKHPELLFQAPAYNATGALYFRSRNYPRASANLTWIPDLLTLLRSRNVSVDDPVVASQRSDKTGINFFWRFIHTDLVNKQSPHASPTLQFPAFNDIQDSSIIVFDKRSHPKTLIVLRELLPTFDIGYGDKEIFWIATTIADEPYSFEPFLTGQYGDCHGVVMHFDPLSAHDPAHATPFHINGEYLVEKDITFVGEFATALITQPILITPTLSQITDLNTWPMKTKRGDSGCTCPRYECVKAPASVQSHLLLQQWLTVSIRTHLSRSAGDSLFPGSLTASSGAGPHSAKHGWTPHSTQRHAGHRKDSTLSSHSSCVPTSTESVDLLHSIFRQKITANDCTFIGCPHLPMTINHSLPWVGTPGTYCEPVSFHDPHGEAVEPPLKTLAEEARRPDSKWHIPEFLQDNVLVQSTQSRTVYVFLNNSLHKIPNMKVLAKYGLNISDVHRLPPLRFHNIPQGKSLE